ncbi:MAG: MinD/ParA family ATP-binding protein [Jatrophihabitans sp.]|uniref:MinD/ParA family ATP-binding protein n=1 Tax=Jatrophihabitans sp. TaxID=1932789 RepID=UPI003F7F9A81
MILAICADKGAPGVTTAATALSVAWPGRRVLLEADPSGGDLALRLRGTDGRDGGELAVDRTLTSLVAGLRDGVTEDLLERHAQPASLGFDVITSPLAADGLTALAPFWPQVADLARRWPGTVLADFGRLQAGHAAQALATGAEGVLLVTRAATREDLYHLRERARALAPRLGPGPRGWSALVVAVVCPPRDAKYATSQAQQALVSQPLTATVPVLGYLALDDRAVAQLTSGPVTKRLLASSLLRSARDLAAALTGWFPALADAADGDAAPPVDDIPAMGAASTGTRAGHEVGWPA